MTEEARTITVVGSTISGNTANHTSSEDVIETEPDTFDLILDPSDDEEGAYFDGRLLTADDLSDEQDPPPPQQDAEYSPDVAEIQIMDSTFDV